MIRSLIICLLLSIALLQVTKLLGWAIDVCYETWPTIRAFLFLLKRALLKFNLVNTLKAAILTGMLYACEGVAEDIYNFITDYTDPVYAGQFETMDTEHQASIFEQEIRKLNTDEYVAGVVIQHTRAVAERIGIPRVWIYEVARAECGLKPYTVHRERIAAGWCQLTRAGCTGITWHGRPLLLEDVLQACDDQQIETLMQFSDAYMVDRWLLRKSPVMLRSVDMYLLLFAPGLIGAADETVIYEGRSNPAYYKNQGIDGYYLDIFGRIEHSSGHEDGKITVYELALRQEKIKNSLLKNYQQ